MKPLFWIRYALRSFRRSGSRGAFAVLCVVVGVAGVVALQTATLTIQNALTSNVRSANGGDISVAVESAPLSGTDLTVFQRLQARHRITAWTAISTLHATAVGSNGRLIPFDVNVVHAPPFPLGGQPTFVSPGNGNVTALLHRSGDVLVTSVLADELGSRVGSRLSVNGIGGTGLSGTVRGILAETNFGHAATMTVNAVDAPKLTTGSSHYTSVYLNATTGISKTAALLRADFPAATVQTVPEALNNAQLQVHDFQQFMLLVGLLALLIAGVGILNAMQSSLAQRRLEIATLKALGFGQGTLYILFGLEALIIGVLGGVAGTVVGALASKTIATALAQALAIQVEYVLDVGTLLAGVALGAGSALVFAVVPIIRAAAIRPLEILREGSGTSLTGWYRTVLPVVLLIVLFVALASITLGDTTLALQFVVGALIICTVLAGMFWSVATGMGRLGPTGALPVGVPVLLLLLALTALAVFKEPSLAAIAALATFLWAATVILPRRLLLSLLIAARSLSRRRTRTAVTLVAFLAGVLAMSLTLTVALSLQRQINDALNAAGSTNLVAISTPAKEASVVASTRSLVGIQSRRVTSVVQTRPVAVNGQRLAARIGPAPVGGDPEAVDERYRLLNGITGWDLRAGDGPTTIRLVDGRRLGPQDVGTSHVMLRSGLEGPPYSLHLGDTVTLRDAGSGRDVTVKVVGFYSRSRVARAFGSFFTQPVYADRSLVVRLGGADAQSIVALTVNPDNLAADATLLQRRSPGTLVIDVGSLTAIVEKILNELLQLLAVITAMVLGAGLAVVANGVGLAMLERRREIAIFKAIGFGPGRVLRFVLLESGLIGLLAGTFSVLTVAIALRILSQFALRREVGFDPLVAVLVLALATALAVLTAYLAARRPVRIRPIEALRNE